jgi:N-acetylglucosaminyldiphosphoundecaprenol N-acetyl-beta-D-mannosaminyltransferase
LSELVEASIAAITGVENQVTFACANPHSLAVAQDDAVFKAALMSTDMVVADGIGVSVMARLLKVDVGPRITGYCYFSAILGALAEKGGGRVFFFGSSELVLRKIADRFAKDYPTLTLCGVLSPPFGEWGELQNRDMIRQINEAKPDVLWVGMTAPKQEKWVEANRALLLAPVIGSIGAVFDFYAGTYPRAPVAIRRTGLEWLYRLIREPRRMWRRTFISVPRFVLASVIRTH